MSFPKYPAYKDSELELFGEVPQHWEVTRLKNVASLRVSTVDKHVLDDELPVSVCHYVQVYYNRRITSAVTFVEGTVKPDEAVEFTLRRNDVVITKDSETPDDIAVAALVAEDIPNLVCGYHLAILRPHPEELDGTFLYYLQESQPLRAYYTVTARGVTRYGLPHGGMASSPVLLPPLAEQRAIAAFLDAETARIDALVAKQEALIATLQEKRRALISHAVTKGVDPAAPMRDSGVPWLGEVPAHWEVKRLKYLSPYITVGVVVTPSKYYIDSGIPCLRSLNVREGRLLDTDLVYISEESNQVLRKSMIFEGDLVSVRSGQPGTTAVVDRRFHAANCIDLILIRQSPLFDSHYLCYQLNSDYAKLQYGLGSDGAIQQHFNIETASNLVVLHPPIEEQRLLLAFLNHETAQLDTLIAKAQAFIELLREHRTALIAAAVTGQIDVRGYGAGTDEPGEVTL